MDMNEKPEQNDTTGVTVGDLVTLSSTHPRMNPILQQHEGDIGRVLVEGTGFNAKCVLVQFEGGYKPMHAFWVNRKRLTPNTAATEVSDGTN